MSDTLIATLGGLLAMLTWGGSDWLDSRVSKKYNPIEANLTIQLPGIISIIALFASGQQTPSLNNAIIIFFAGLFFTVAFVAFIKALSHGHVGIVVPLANTYPLVPIVLSAIFLSTILKSLQYLAILLIIGGVVILAFEKRYKRVPKPILQHEIYLAFLAAILWGIGIFVLNTVVEKESWLAIFAFINISMIAGAFLIWLIQSHDHRKEIRSVVVNKLGLTAGLLLTFGSFGWYFGAERAGSFIIPSVIASASPLVASYISALIDKEKLTIIKRAGAVIVVAGIIMLNI